MKIFIVYAHPGGVEDSFTESVKNKFIEGLVEAGHEFIVSDLYKMGFVTDMSESEYFREVNLRTDLPVPPDVLAEQEKINSCDAIVFIYPLFWADVPAKLKGWFDRVWTFGFAYGENRSMKTLEKGLVVCVAGNTIEQIKNTGQYECVKASMLTDRLFDRVKTKELIILDGASKLDMDSRKYNLEKHLKNLFNAAVNLLGS